MSRNVFRQFDNFLGSLSVNVRLPWRCMKHNLIADIVMKPRWFLKIVWENFVVNNFLFFYVRIVKGPKINIFTCKLCAWVIFIILFSRLLCDNSNSLTYEQRKGAKPNTFTCQLCDCPSHADLLFTIMMVTRLNVWRPVSFGN